MSGGSICDRRRIVRGGCPRVRAAGPAAQVDAGDPAGAGWGRGQVWSGCGAKRGEVGCADADPASRPPQAAHRSARLSRSR